MSSTTTTTNSTTQEADVLLFPNEWLMDYIYHQPLIDDLDVPFGAISDATAVSDDTSFGDDVVFPASGCFSDDVVDNIFAPPPGYDTAGFKVSGAHETMLDHNVTGGAAAATASMFSPENSSAASSNNVDLSPKATVGKQVKRRSRASRRTPTTLLNASIKNFRALVQQYTGCQSAAPGFNRNGKGPITLSFGGPSDRNHDFPAASFSSPFDGSYYYNDHHQQQPHQFQMNQQQRVDQIYGGKQSLY